MVTLAEPGLRERKRVATKRAIELAAIKLVARNGFERLTIDEIVHAADVSPRTFFNYFPSKEAALIGDTPRLPDSAQIEAFVHAGRGAGIFAGISDLLSNAADATVADHELSQLRRNILKQRPELLAMRMTTMRQFEDELGKAVARRLAEDEPHLAKDQDALVRRARLVTLVAFAAMRHAWACWADARNASDLAARLTASFAELESLFTTGAIR
jgi:AcrR family transcriptional regulator